jgi:hypothetical protein
MREPIVSSHQPQAHDGLWQDRRTYSPKEVATVNSTKLWMTAQTPSCFGMPISGHDFGASIPATESRLATTTVVRDRAAAAQGAVKGGMAYFPGTSAWRPPTC